MTHLQKECCRSSSDEKYVIHQNTAQDIQRGLGQMSTK